MFHTKSYALVKVPIKKTRRPGKNSQMDLEMPSSDLKELETLRESCVKAFDRVWENIENVRGLDKFLSTEKEREDFVTAVTSSVDSYVSHLISLVARNEQFGVLYFYVWTSSLFEKQNVAYDDYRYDICGMYYNVGATLMNLAQYVLCVKSTVSTVTALEKEAYRVLLKAAGYFSLSRSVVVAMKKRVIAAVDMPAPFGPTESIVEFLEFVALGQAQEIGMAKAEEADPKAEKPLLARLCHQCLDLHETAKAAARRIVTANKDFTKISVVVLAKCDIYRAFSYSYAASCTMGSTPSDALRHISNATLYMKRVEGYKTGKVNLAFDCDKVVEQCLKAVRLNVDRITRINSLVERAKPTEGDVALPPPCVLAQTPELRLPVPLPDPAAPDPPVS